MFDLSDPQVKRLLEVWQRLDADQRRSLLCLAIRSAMPEIENTRPVIASFDDPRQVESPDADDIPKE